MVMGSPVDREALMAKMGLPEAPERFAGGCKVYTFLKLMTFASPRTVRRVMMVGQRA
jgi:hypothetical protein